MNRAPSGPMDLFVANASEVLTCAGTATGDIGRIAGGAVAVGGGRVIAVGPEAELRSTLDTSVARVIDARGCAVAPGFVDSHTHLVFGGSRVREYASRLTRTREETIALGIPVGILATVEATRAATRDELVEAAIPRLDEMLAHGTTTVESKSGYGLTTTDEVKLLEVNRLLGDGHPVEIVSTFMGAHDVPIGMDRSVYVDQVVQEQIPEVARTGLASFCDVFCEDGFFTVQDARRVLEAGMAAGLTPKIHAEQYARTGGALLAAELGCASADHLNFAEAEDLAALAESGVAAVLMPLIDFAVRHPNSIDAGCWVKSGITIALGTDMCPGGYAASMPLAIQFACRGNGLSPEQALVAATRGAARACGLAEHGRLSKGAIADLQIWDVASLEEMVYRTGHNPVRQVIKRGKVVYG